MPGIVGLITKQPRGWAEPQLLRMVESLHHNASYKTGTLGVYVGWVVRDGESADGMPVRNENGNIVLLFAGEEFPEPGTARRLKNHGHVFAEGGPS